MPRIHDRFAARRLAVLVTAAALLASGCTGITSSSPADEAPAAGGSRTRPAPSAPGDSGDSGAARSGSAAVPPAPRGLERFYRQDVTWRACADGFECTRVQVPLDYAEPAGDTVDIAVSRRPADQPAERIGALLVNPGGPGVSGIAYAPAAAQQFRSDVLDRYDVVGFDPRGVAASEGLDCLSDAELDSFIALDPSPDAPGKVATAKQRLAAFGRGCVQGSGGLAAHVSTPEAARDMDIIRAVLDSEKLHYYGASYGTLLGATYADLFPQRVGRMVLDGAINPALSRLQQTLQQAAGFQTALEDYLGSCVRQGQCPLGDSVPAAQRRLRELLESIEVEPLPASGGRRLTVGHAVLGVWLPLYYPQLWPTLTAALDSAIAGEGEPLMRLSDLYTSRGPGGYQNNSIEALYAVNCLDHPQTSSAAEIRRLLPRFEKVSPVFGEGFAWSLLGCPGWPVRTSEPIPKIDAPGAAPIVVVGTTGDPATPYESAVALAERLRSGVLVTRVGEGHTGFARGNQCVDDAVNDFFAKGNVPRDGLRCS